MEAHRPQADALVRALRKAGEVSRKLMAAGLAPDTPVALVESASLPCERQFHSRLYLCLRWRRRPRWETDLRCF